MKYLIIGGIQEKDYVNDDEENKFKNACINIGRALSNSGDDLVICSPFRDSADYWAFKGFAEEQNNLNKGIVEMHFIDKKEVCDEIEKLKSNYKSCNISKIPHPSPNNNDVGSLKYSWLLCQLEALESCQEIIAIGGKLDGSSNMLLLFAEARRKAIIPLLFMRGAAAQSFYRRRYEIQDKFGDEYSTLLQDEKNVSKTLLISKDKYAHKSINDLKDFFISYPRTRTAEADYVETLLRRRNMKVFRDESDFGAGSDIPKKIEEAIYKSTVFIAIWCKEYACSPWCFDEIELALDRFEQGKLELCILRVDDTRIVPKRARDIKNYTIESRTDIESCVLKLLE